MTTPAGILEPERAKQRTREIAADALQRIRNRAPQWTLPPSHEDYEAAHGDLEGLTPIERAKVVTLLGIGLTHK